MSSFAIIEVPVQERKFCDIPIITDPDMPVGVAAIVSADGRRLGTILNIDIETCGPVPEGPPQIEYGSRSVTGEFTAHFDVNKEAYARFLTGMARVARDTTETIIRLGDQFARHGGLNRAGRKQWRKDRKRLTASLRRSDARVARQADGLAAF